MAVIDNAKQMIAGTTSINLDVEPLKQRMIMLVVYHQDDMTSLSCVFGIASANALFLNRTCVACSNAYANPIN